MNLTITGHHLDITPAIKEYVSTKLARVARHVDNIVDVQVILSVEPHKHLAEMTIRVPGKDLHCEASEENLYTAIDLLTDKADRLVVKNKSKQQEHSAPSAKRLSV